MSALALILAAHLLGDWVVQTDWQAAHKTTEWRAMTHHLIGYHVLVAAALIAIRPSWWYALVILGTSAITHGFLDRRWPVAWLMRRTGSAAFADQTWGVLAVDQALHVSILALLVAPL